MADLDLDSLLAPLQDDAPCGPDLEYDAAFLALQTVGAGKPEQQYGDTVIPAEEPDWAAVWTHALDLAQRTRDLRVAVWLTRAGARLQGHAVALQGLRLIEGLLQRHWDHVHPQLDADDGNDPTMRLNALQPLGSDAELLADLRAAVLTGQRGGPRVRDVELAFGSAEPAGDESVPSPQGLESGLSAWAAQDAAFPERLQAGVAAVQGIVDAIEQPLGVGAAPDLTPLRKVLQPLAALGSRLSGSDGATLASGADAAIGIGGAAIASAAGVPGSHVVQGGHGVIASREDAMRALERAAEWIERNEPTNPAPLLIRRAQRLMGKNFMDIIRDLVPDGLHEIEKLAGQPD